MPSPDSPLEVVRHARVLGKPRIRRNSTTVRGGNVHQYLRGLAFLASGKNMTTGLKTVRKTKGTILFEKVVVSEKPVVCYFRDVIH